MRSSLQFIGVGVSSVFDGLYDSVLSWCLLSQSALEVQPSICSWSDSHMSKTVYDFA